MSRRSISHFEVPGGTSHVTWSLKRGQPPLNDIERSIVQGVIVTGRDFGAVIEAGVVMDDHVHVLFSAGSQRTSNAFITSWKGVSANRLVRATGRTSPVWQRDYFQRWIRTPQHVMICACYIRNNPRRRWPGINDYPWILP